MDRCKLEEVKWPNQYHYSQDQLPKFHAAFYETIISESFVQGNLKHAHFHKTIGTDGTQTLLYHICTNHIDWTNLTVSKQLHYTCSHYKTFQKS